MDLPNPILDDAGAWRETGPPHSDSTPVQRDICIIGAGPSGLGALKVIRDHPLFTAGVWSVEAYEARESIGGIWLPAESSPVIDPSKPPLTPLYDALTTNLPHPVMAYPSLSFPPSTPLYPPASTVLHYLETYAETFNLTQHIHFRSPILRASWQTDKCKWLLKVQSDLETREEEFDVLLVANGHYSFPRYPTTPGLQAWLDTGRATHSVYYRNPSHPPAIQAAETVLVVGAGPSGLDIASELRTSARKRIVHSFSAATREDLEDGDVKRRARVKVFLDAGKGEVEFEDGTKESGIDHCVLATGYQHRFPFFDSSTIHLDIPPSIPPLPAELYNSTYHVFPLAKHLFPLVSTYPPFSLAFIALPYRVVPFPLAETQTRAVLKVLEHPDSLDPTQEAVDVVSRYEHLRATALVRKSSLSPSAVSFAIAETWHMLEEEQQFNYRDALHAFAGPPYDDNAWKSPQWVKDFYPLKWLLRQEWKEMERTGEAAEWVKGVGEGGEHEWVDLMTKFAQRVQKKQGREEEIEEAKQRTRL